MLRLHPDKRAKASDLIYHNWLEGVMVQGEIDVIRRAEEEEEARRREKESSFGRSGRRVSALTQSEVDAMKPVDDVIALGEMSRGETDSAPPDVVPLAHHPPKLFAAPVPSSANAKENAPRPTSTTTTPTRRGTSNPSAQGSGSKRRS
jgi:serine/threonine-protein kinase SRPK3